MKASTIFLSETILVELLLAGVPLKIDFQNSYRTIICEEFRRETITRNLSGADDYKLDH